MVLPQNFLGQLPLETPIDGRAFPAINGIKDPLPIFVHFEPDERIVCRANELKVPLFLSVAVDVPVEASSIMVNPKPRPLPGDEIAVGHVNIVVRALSFVTSVFHVLVVCQAAGYFITAAAVDEVHAIWVGALGGWNWWRKGWERRIVPSILSVSRGLLMFQSDTHS